MKAANKSYKLDFGIQPFQAYYVQKKQEVSYQIQYQKCANDEIGFITTQFSGK